MKPPRQCAAQKVMRPAFLRPDPSLRHALATAGFTLIELLVALAIVALSLITGHKASSTLIASSARQENILLGQICAHNALNQLRLARQLPAVGNNSSNCLQAERSYDVRVQVRTTANTAFRRVDAYVENEGRRVLTLSTVMGQY